MLHKNIATKHSKSNLVLGLYLALTGFSFNAWAVPKKCNTAYKTSSKISESELNKSIEEIMKDPAQFRLHQAINEFKNLPRAIEHQYYDKKKVAQFNRWLKTSGWQEAVLARKIPDLSKFPKNGLVQKQFVIEYFTALFGTKRTIHDMAKEEIQSQLEFYREKIEVGPELWSQHKKKGQSEVDEILAEINWERHVKDLDPNIIKAIKSKSKADQEKFLKAAMTNHRRKVNRALKLTEQIVQLSNIKLAMYRVETPDQFAGKNAPFLENNISRSSSGLLRHHQQETKDYAETLFAGTNLAPLMKTHKRAMYQKYAFIEFKELPKGIKMIPSFSNPDARRFIGSFLYRVNLDQVVDRSVYLPHDGSFYWKSKTDILTTNVVSDYGKFQQHLREDRGMLIFNDLTTLRDLTNLKKHVFFGVLNYREITLMDKLGMELMIFGEMKYGEDFQ
ncbi:MAG: hypothetical protein AB8E15_13255 [Bdellovibrionales bacterium]